MGNAEHLSTGSTVLHSGEIANVSLKFAEGYARIREVTDSDNACSAMDKAMFMACAAAARNNVNLLDQEIARARELGLRISDAQGAALALLISRGEGIYSTFITAVNLAYQIEMESSDHQIPDYEINTQEALDYFSGYFGHVPSYIDLMAKEAPRALEGYVLMREWALSENTLEPKIIELLLCTVNAAEFSSTVKLHAAAARKAGASEAEIVESVVCAIPASGLTAWVLGAAGITESA